jgi:signal transduction histidine kinase
MSNDTIEDGVILVVKDATKNLLKLSNALKLSNFTVLEASDLKSSLAIAKSVQPNLIILDMRMSGGNDWKISRQLKTDPQTKDIFLVMMGASLDLLDEIKQFNWNAIDHLPSSMSLKEVMNRIKTHLTSQSNQQKKSSVTNSSSTMEADLILANHRLETLNQELLLSNQDLENFVSIVSHDLQAPLRSLTMFAELLAQEYREELDIEASRYIERITDSGTRMQILIQDLLIYSRAGKGQETWVSVALKETINEVIQDLQSTIRQNQAIIIVEDLPTVIANAIEIRQLFQNLIDNAIKFRSQEQPEIKIEAQQQQEQWLISIKDNGIGIEPEFQEQIFQVFQRIHPSDAYPGTGIGLAICQKIVQRCGGKIWVESQPGVGSTFFFTLPLRFSQRNHLVSPNSSPLISPSS